MSDPSTDGIRLTKEYATGGKDLDLFKLTDLQWGISEIADDFTLYDTFRLIQRAEIAFPGIAAAFGMPEFGKFWDQIHLDRCEDDKNYIEYLELYWWLTYDVRVVPKTKEQISQAKTISDRLSRCASNYWDNHKRGEMANLMSFHGVGPGCPMKDDPGHACDNKCPEDTCFGVSHSSVNNLKHLPIRIISDTICHPPYVEPNRKLEATDFSLKMDPTLWCFLTSICFELTFCGYLPNETLQERKDKEVQDEQD